MASRFSKDQLRVLALQKRSQINAARRFHAEELMTSSLLERLKERRTILSYAAIGSELNLDRFNALLAAEGRLVLPRIEGSSLGLYQVFDPELEIVPCKWGIRQPNPHLCPKIEAKTLDALLVPALLFDEQKMRLGYGKGYFDRLLTQLNENTLILGVGFEEQLHGENLPIEAHDKQLQELLLL